ncbi:MAG: hypothetical protein JXB62_10210 [Pirellulales bacterium]|nr:hypothetical protein [Pirellulales bacterium]
MENQPIHDERILEAIEACRPGSDDVADPALEFLAAEFEAHPELARRYQQIQRLDAQLTAAFRDVPVPEGAEQRLLARLAETAAEQASVPRRIGRRWLLATGGVLTTAAALFLALWLGGPADLGAQAVLEEAIRFYNQESPRPGQLVADVTPPKGYPISRAVLPTPQLRWRAIRDFVGCRGVAYDLSRGGAEATLYVVQCDVAGLPSRPAPRPAYATAGCSTSAWREADRLYVLVVRGDAGTHQGFIAPRGPLT